MAIASAESWVTLIVGIGIMQASPGPAVLTIVGYSLEFGRTLAVRIFAAFVLGQLTALILGIAGFGLLLSTAPEAMGVLRFTSGCLLLFVGLSALMRKRNINAQPKLQYLKAIEHCPQLNAEQEKRYSRLALMGDEDARAKMVEYNLRLLVDIVKRYSNRGLSRLDLLIEGYRTLIDSVQKFDPERGIRFSSHAAWRIRQTLECALLINKSRIIHQQFARFSATETPASRIKQPRGIRVRLTPVDVSLKSDADSQLPDSISYSNPDSTSDLQFDGSHRRISKWLMKLEPRYRNIIVRRFGLNDYEHITPDEEHGRTSTARYAFVNTWLITASSPIGITFYIAVFSNYFDVSNLASSTFIYLVSVVLGISIVIGTFYISVSCFTGKMLGSSAIGKQVSSIANLVLVLTGIWVITSVLSPLPIAEAIESLPISLVFTVAIIYLISGTVKGLSGIGMGLIAVPVISILYQPALAVSLIAIPLIVTNFHQGVISGNVVKTLKDYSMLASVLFVVMTSTVYFSVSFASSTIAWMVGLSAILFVVLNLGFKSPTVSDRHDSTAQIITGCTAGLVGGITGLAVIPLTIYIMMRGIQKNQFIAVSGFLLLLSGLALLVGGYLNNTLTQNTLIISSLVSLPALIGTLIGEKLRAQISEGIFRKIILCLVFGIGVNILSQQLAP